MSESENPPYPDYSPEQKSAIYAKYKDLFTVEDLIELIDDEGPRHPAEEVMAEAREILRGHANKRAKDGS